MLAKTIPAVAALALGAAVCLQADTAPASSYRALLDRYCVTCHNERVKSGGLVLEKTAVDLEHVGGRADVFEKVVNKLRTGAMPPAGLPRPDKPTSDAFAAWLETSLDQAALARPNPGRPAAHRLNRAEYANAIRDLLALEIDGASLLPADDAGYGFDNNADVLSISPGLLERYMSAARRISRLAVGDLSMREQVDSYQVSRYRLQDDRVSEDLPFGSRGGLAVRHYFPLDAEYVVKVQLQQRRRGPEPQQLEIRLDGERVKLFTIGGQARMDEAAAERQGADGGLQVRIAVKAGSRLIGVALLQRTVAPEGLAPAYLPVGNISFRGRGGSEVGVETVQIAGPYEARGAGDTPSRRRIFACRPAAADAQTACARKILGALARRAYRQPVAPKDVETLLGFYRSGRREGGFDAGVQWALERILVDPRFLFRVERDPAHIAPGAPYRLGDVELASRLSFFLWSSIPDDELLDAAVRGTLKDDRGLERQVRRMLADPRAAALVTNFGAEWLYLRNIRAVVPDVNAFPRFDDDLREALARETELFFESQLGDDRPVGEMLTADYTFLNERLARHYGIGGVYGSHFRRVALTDPARQGLLGQGSILTVTSYATRTSPVLRGKWLLENILGAPPPPPPPNVPALKESDADGKPASVRERMEQHRKNPVCASCHARMDPLGFALENFDAIGQWRTTSEAQTPIDASASLPDGTTFHGPAELRALLLSRRHEFVRTVAEKLLTYALGRGVDAADMPAVRRMLRESAATDDRWSSLILAVVRSTPFQMRRSEP